MFGEVIEFLGEHWVNILSIMFGLIGVFGSIVGYLSWRSGNKTQQVHEYLFTLAGQNIEKENLEQGIQKRKKTLQQTDSQLSDLQSKIERDIPIAARKAVLRDKLNTQVEHLTEMCESIEQVRQELDRLGEFSALPTQLEKAIESEINPDYIRKRRLDTYRNYFTLVIGSASVASVLLPYPFSRWLSWLIMVAIGIPILFKLIKLSLPKFSLPGDSLTYHNVLRILIFLSLLLFGTIGLILGILETVGIIILDGSHFSSYEVIDILCYLGLGVLCLLGAKIYRRRTS